MKKLAIILGILIFADILFFSYINTGAVYELYYPYLGTFSLDSGVTIATMGFYGALGAYLVCLFFMSELKDKLKKSSRITEKASIETTESSDKIKQLEAKIETLEVALKNVLNK